MNSQGCQAGRVFLSQKKYVEKVLEGWIFNTSNWKPVFTPFAAHFKLSSFFRPVPTNEWSVCNTFLILV